MEKKVEKKKLYNLKAVPKDMKKIKEKAFKSDEKPSSKFKMKTSNPFSTKKQS